MSDKSSIEWTEATWNPTTGCTKISSGCAHCYAERFAERFRGVVGHPYEQGFDLKIWENRLNLPLTWRKPRTVFVNSMSDLFHEDVPEDFILKVFDVMAKASQHHFQVLTKRPDRMLKISESIGGFPPNVWAGVSVESQQWAWRIDLLRKVKTLVRFLSCEPLLAPLELDLTDIDWVIVGGESGIGARPIAIEWVRDIRDQCLQDDVAFFFKQWGGVRKKKTGRLLDDREWNEMPMKIHQKQLTQIK